MEIKQVIDANIPMTPFNKCPILHAAYKQMACDETRESEALEWAEATIGDSSNEAWFGG